MKMLYFKISPLQKLFFIILISITFTFIHSCKDIIDVEPKYEKDLISKMITPFDSLKFLDIMPMDFGSVKLRTVNTLTAIITNKSNIYTISIYSLKAKDQTGMFQYNYPMGLPFQILPNENIGITGKINVKFVADAFKLGFYYDTLIINNNPAFYLPVKVYERY